MKNKLNQYYRAIRRCLPCSGKQKQQIMDRIRQSVSSYMDEDPLADFSAVQAHFGTPEQIAHTYIAEMEIPDIAKNFERKKCVVTIISIAAAAALLLWSTALIIALINEFNSVNHYITTTPVEVIDEWELDQ